MKSSFKASQLLYVLPMPVVVTKLPHPHGHTPSWPHHGHLGVASLNVPFLAALCVAELVQEPLQLKDDHLPVALVQAVRLGHSLDDVGELHHQLVKGGTHLVTPHLTGTCLGVCV